MANYSHIVDMSKTVLRDRQDEISVRKKCINTFFREVGVSLMTMFLRGHLSINEESLQWILSKRTKNPFYTDVHRKWQMVNEFIQFQKIRHFRQQEGSNSHAVQQEVSSSNPHILSNDQIGSVLLEALDGFLFVVNREGRVEYVTDNITQYINYTKDDVLGKVIYSIIHYEDHNIFRTFSSPMSSLAWISEPPTRNRTFDCCFLVKPPDDKNETMEEKLQRVSKYETMQICSALLPNNADRSESGDVFSESGIGPSVMCVARRISPNKKRINPPLTSEQFTVKLDTTWKIIAVDVSWLSPAYSNYLTKDWMIGSTFKDFCHPHDLSTLTKHLSDTIEVGESTSDVYRLRVSHDKFLKIQTRSKFYEANVVNDIDFMMATSYILEFE